MAFDEVFVAAISKSLTKPNKAEAVQDLAAMCLALSRRIRELEARKAPHFRGLWQEGKIYGPGDWCGYGGSVWGCLEPTTVTRPSTRDPAWAMAVAHGRDGKSR